MSPIGRVFIVLNLVLAGTFVGFAGTYLQRQDDYNKLYKKATADLESTKQTLDAERRDALDKINASDVAKTRLENELNSVKGERDRLSDENTRLTQRIATVDADLKSLSSSAQAIQSEVKTAFSQWKEVNDKAMAAEATKDAAVREKDQAVADLKAANAKIGDQEAAISNKDQQIAMLNKDNGELKMLVSVAKVKGFLESMAVPPLAGTVSHVSGNLVTIAVTSNPSNSEIQPGFKFAIYDGSTYKAEAVVQSADSEKNAAFCRLEIVKGQVAVGDKASTNTN